MNVDFIKHSKNIKNKKIRFKVLDKLIERFIPFNRGLNFKIIEISDEKVVVESPENTRRKNHVGGAHACALALLGEYPAGIYIASKYPPNKYRFIISALEIEYIKQGKGRLKSVCLTPNAFPEIKDGEGWAHMVTQIFNEKDEEIATCKTRWQIKEWTLVK